LCHFETSEMKLDNKLVENDFRISAIWRKNGLIIGHSGVG
jgi:hypothetical protein